MPINFTQPPLIEAICQFQFVPAADRPFDSTVPGLMYAQIQDDFFIREEQPGLRLQFAVGILAQPAVQPQVSPITNRVFFKRKDGTAVVQIGSNFLAVNQLPPYPNWSVFQALILENLKIYREVAQPEMLLGAELRYINRIELPFIKDGMSVNIADYVTAYPHVSDTLLSPTGLRFVQRVEIGMPELKGALVIQSATADAVQENLDGAVMGGILLDLSFTFVDKIPLALDEAPFWIATAHSEVERAFLACITPLARKNFGEKHNV